MRSMMVILLLSAIGIVRAEDLSGRVLDGSHGVALSGVTVSLRNSGRATTTDEEGRYHFSDLTTAAVSGDSLQGGPARDIVSDSDAVASADPSAFDVISFRKDGYTPVGRELRTHAGVQNIVLTLAGKVTYVCTTADRQGRWQIARTVFDLQTRTSEITYLTDSSQWNFKPNFSPDGSRLTFFRRYVANGPCCETWRSSVCVMNADGSGLHEIIAGQESFNTEPYWSRDGNNRVSFNRMNVPDAGPWWSQSDAMPGAEQKLAAWGWINPHLSDGRVFLQQRGGKSFLAAPSGDGSAKTVRVQRPDELFIHKIALSRDETLIAYQKWVDRDHNMYKGGVMVYAKFDASVPSISNEVIFDELNPETMAWYVSISTDNRYLLFAKDGAIMQHDVQTGTTLKVSADSDPYKAYPTYTTFCK